MSARIIHVALTAILAVTCMGLRVLYGQTVTPNFSGTWVYDKKKSKASDWQKKNRLGSELVIEHEGVESKIESRNPSNPQGKTEKDLFYTDGRGEKFSRSSLGSQVETESKTIWEGTSLVRTYSYEMLILQPQLTGGSLVPPRETLL